MQIGRHPRRTGRHAHRAARLRCRPGARASRSQPQRRRTQGPALRRGSARVRPPRRARPRARTPSGRGASRSYDRGVTGEELRETMRRFPAPVAVVTGNDDGEVFGLTVGSLVSLSLDPPLVGISVGKDSARHEPLRSAGAFAVSILSEEQAELAKHFARSGVPPLILWEGVAARAGERGPLLEGARAWLECDVWAEY